MIRKRGWERRWARLLRCLSVLPFSPLGRRADERGAARLGALRLGIYSAALPLARPPLLGRDGASTRPAQRPATLLDATALAGDPALRRHYPYVAALLAELAQPAVRVAPAVRAAPAVRRRAAR